MSPTSTPFTVRWGILATGGIAETFTKDILTNPATRSVTDVAHVVAAAASSSSSSRARDFLTKVGAPSTAKAYGSYAEMVQDPDIDIIYVATPHSHHFQNTMLALTLGNKPVLCEKAFTVNAEQTQILIDTARAKGLFLMEAVWTRYFPLSIKIREMVSSGEIGVVHRVVADFSCNHTNDDGTINFPDENRMVNIDLAGGALLDLGIYSLTWIYQILYHCQPEARREAPNVVSAITKYERTGADAMTSMILTFPKQQSVGIAMTGLIGGYEDSKHDSGPCVQIFGSKGEIQVMGRPFKPTGYRVMLNEKPGVVDEVKAEYPQDAARGNWGHGMYWEADEAARCLRDGKLESTSMGWEESLVIMKTMDEVRRGNGLKYPDLIESTVYDEKSPLNVARS